MSAGIAVATGLRVPGPDRTAVTDMAYELRADEKFGKAMRRLVRKQIQNTIKVLSGAAPAQRAEAVHDARKRIKKIRSVLRLGRDVLGNGTYRSENTAFRDIGRRLSEVRDAEVLIEAADKLADEAAGRLPAGLADHVRDVLSARRDAAVRHAFEDADEPGHVIVELTDARDRLPDWPNRGSGWSALRGGLQRVYRQGRDAMETAYADPTFENLHEWRKRVKNLWHSLVLMRPVWPALLEPAADQTHELSDLLGDDHDLSVLEQTLRASPAEFGTEAALAAAYGVVAGRRDRLRREAKPLGRRVYAESPSDLAGRMHAYWCAWRESPPQPEPQPEPPQPVEAPAAPAAVESQR